MMTSESHKKIWKEIKRDINLVEAYMDALNLFFSALGNGADAYDDSTWTKNEKDLARNIASILFQAGVDIS